MNKKETLIKLYNAKVESCKDSNMWCGIISDDVLDRIFKNEEALTTIILDLLEIPAFDNHMKDYVNEVICDIAEGNESEGYAHSVEQLVDELLE